MAVRGVKQHLPQVDSDNLTLDMPIHDDGSRSQVWSGTLLEPETGIRHPVAVKRFPGAESAEQLRSIHREIGVMVLASQRSHFAARTWGWCQDKQGMLCAVMKRYTRSMHHAVRATKGQGIGLHATQRYGRQIATGVAELHGQNVIISDLKPANVLLDEFDNCAISDFGISTLIMGRESDADGIHGTFQYMSPEAFEGQKVTTRTDAWSFACTVCEMASGRPPWHGTSMSAICFKVTASRETPAIPESLPERVRSLLARCFAFDARDRPSFAEIVTIFSEDWCLAPEPGTPPAHSAGLSETERHELAALRAEQEQWRAERREAAEKRAADAQLVARLQGSLAEHQDVNEQLQEKLVLLLESVKAQQRTGGEGGPEGGRAAALEGQLVACQEALQSVMRQKDIAKEMLKQEAARARGLSEEAERLRLLVKTLRATAHDRDRTIALQAARLGTLASPAHERPPRPLPGGAPLAPHAEWGADGGEQGASGRGSSEDYTTFEPFLSESSEDSVGLTKLTSGFEPPARADAHGAHGAQWHDRALSQATTPSVSAQVSWEMRGSRGSIGKAESQAPPRGFAPPQLLLREPAAPGSG